MLVKSSHNDPRGSLQYAKYINENPLYIHNHKWYFENTLKNLNLMSNDPFSDAVAASEKYIRYLENREKRILKAVGGKKNLELIARDMYVDNQNVKEIIKLLDKVFGMNQDVRTSVGRYSGEKNPFLRLVKNVDGSKNLQKIELITTGTKQAHGRTINEYDFKASAALIENGGEIELELRRIVNNINDAIKEQGDLQKMLQQFVDEGVIREDFEPGKVLDRYLNNKALSENAMAEDLLKFIVDKMGIYSYLKGKYSESSKFKFTDTIKEIFGENFKPESGDTRTREERAGTLKKADIILKGGKIDGKTVPEITISRKTVSAKDFLKFQDSPLKGPSGGIYQALQKESESVANLYLYLTLNSSFWSGLESSNIYLKFFNKIMSYVFISGNTEDKSYQKAVYLIITTGHGDNIETSFVPISSIIKSIIYNDEAEIKITATKKNAESDISLNGPLWKAKLATAGRRTNKKGRGLRYKVLSQDRNVLQQAEELAGPLLTRNRRIGINYNFLEDAIKSYGIITRRNNG